MQDAGSLVAQPNERVMQDTGSLVVQLNGQDVQDSGSLVAQHNEQVMQGAAGLEAPAQRDQPQRAGGAPAGWPGGIPRAPHHHQAGPHSSTPAHASLQQTTVRGVGSLCLPAMMS